MIITPIWNFLTSLDITTGLIIAAALAVYAFAKKYFRLRVEGFNAYTWYGDQYVLTRFYRKRRTAVLAALKLNYEEPGNTTFSSKHFVWMIDLMDGSGKVTTIRSDSKTK